MTTFERIDVPPGEAPADVVVVGATKGADGAAILAEEASALDALLKGNLTAHLARMRFRGELGECELVPTFGRIRPVSIVIVGLGDAVSGQALRTAAAVAARKSAGNASAALALPPAERGVEAQAEGFLLGAYRFGRYKTRPEPEAPERVLLLGNASDGEIRRGEARAGATNWARDLVNEPAGARGPAEFAEAAAEHARMAGLEAEILDEAALAERGMFGILGVGQGSARPPRLLVLRYEPEGAAAGFVGLVGKGITFDSGGLSIKTAEGMETMKTDCSGAAAVAAAISALPALGPKIRVVAVAPLAENMPDGRAIKPGDVIRHYGGHTSEVLNTDAEGRLVLADAIAWMAEQRPDAMFDVATLTGGMVIALGKKVAGYFANRADLAAEVEAASEASGEPVWRMPLIDDLRAEIDSEIADVKNTGGRWGSPIFGALFLRDFVGEVPWAHLDIAGPARSDKEQRELPKGATGFGTRLLIDWVERRAG
ncbi:MAG: leucyl aminopeptidase [Actinomycetota bacterium]